MTILFLFPVLNLFLLISGNFADKTSLQIRSYFLRSGTEQELYQWPSGIFRRMLMNFRLDLEGKNHSRSGEFSVPDLSLRKGKSSDAFEASFQNSKIKTRSGSTDSIVTNPSSFQPHRHVKSSSSSQKARHSTLKSPGYPELLQQLGVSTKKSRVRRRAGKAKGPKKAAASLNEEGDLGNAQAGAAGFGGNDLGNAQAGAAGFGGNDLGNAQAGAAGYGGNNLGNVQAGAAGYLGNDFGNAQAGATMGLGAAGYEQNNLGNAQAGAAGFGGNDLGNAQASAAGFGGNDLGNAQAGAAGFGGNDLGNAQAGAAGFGGNDLGNAQSGTASFGDNRFATTRRPKHGRKTKRPKHGRNTKRGSASDRRGETTASAAHRKKRTTPKGVVQEVKGDIIIRKPTVSKKATKQITALQLAIVGLLAVLLLVLLVLTVCLVVYKDKLVADKRTSASRLGEKQPLMYPDVGPGGPPGPAVQATTGLTRPSQMSQRGGFSRRGSRQMMGQRTSSANIRPGQQPPSNASSGVSYERPAGAPPPAQPGSVPSFPPGPNHPVPRPPVSQPSMPGTPGQQPSGPPGAITSKSAQFRPGAVPSKGGPGPFY